MKHVVSFSGGKDSTAMLLMMIEKGMPIDKIICVDTTKEFPQMYEHIKKVQAFIAPLKIDIVSFDFDHYFKDHVKVRGKNKGEKGYSWPDFRNRWCTTYKRNAVRKLELEYGFKDVIQYHGIAFDEPARIAKNNVEGRIIKYPLVEWEITEAQALQYCYEHGFDWGGLYEKFARVSCWCCPLSRIGELRILYKDFPGLWEQLREMDKDTFRTFRTDYTVEELNIRFMKEDKNKCAIFFED